MKKIFFNLILLGTLLMSTLISAQVVLTALEAPSNIGNNNGGGDNGGGGGLVLTPKCSPSGSIRERSRTFSRVQSVCQGGVYHMITYYHISFDVCTTVNGGLGYSWLDWRHYTTTETATSNTPTTIKCTQ